MASDLKTPNCPDCGDTIWVCSKCDRALALPPPAPGEEYRRGVLDTARLVELYCESIRGIPAAGFTYQTVAARRADALHPERVLLAARPGDKET